MINSALLVAPVAVHDRAQLFHSATFDRNEAFAGFVGDRAEGSETDRDLRVSLDTLPASRHDFNDGISLARIDAPDHASLFPAFNDCRLINRTIKAGVRNIGVSPATDNGQHHEYRKGDTDKYENKPHPKNSPTKLRTTGRIDPQRLQEDHFTPFGARVTPPVIVLPRRPSRLYRTIAVISPLLWATAIILILYLAVATGSALALLEHQMAMDARV